MQYHFCRDTYVADTDRPHAALKYQKNIKVARNRGGNLRNTKAAKEQNKHEKRVAKN